MNRLILLVESRIRGDVYVRFGGELPKTHRSNTAGRWMLSLPPHDYIQLKEAVKTRYVRLTNIYCPSGKFSVSGLRVFGRSDKPSPPQTKFYRICRNKEDRRSVLLYVRCLVL